MLWVILMEDKYKPICNNVSDARNMFLKDVGRIIDYFSNFTIKKEIVTNNKYSKMPWVDFTFKIYPQEMDVEELSAFIGFGQEFKIDFDEQCIQIYKRYYLKEVKPNV